VVVLLSAGAHVPLIPFKEVIGSGGITAPAQIGATGLNVGVIAGLTVIVRAAADAHWPATGVKV
jgi:hypothetical protein